MKSLEIACRFAGRPGSFRVLVGQPALGRHPLEYQLAWLREVLGGEVVEGELERVEKRLGVEETGGAE